MEGTTSRAKTSSELTSSARLSPPTNNPPPSSSSSRDSNSSSDSSAEEEEVEDADDEEGEAKARKMRRINCSRPRSRWTNSTGNNPSPVPPTLRPNSLKPNGSQHPRSQLAHQAWAISPPLSRLACLYPPLQLPSNAPNTSPGNRSVEPSIWHTASTSAPRLRPSKLSSWQRWRKNGTLPSKKILRTSRRRAKNLATLDLENALGGSRNQGGKPSA